MNRHRMTIPLLALTLNLLLPTGVGAWPGRVSPNFTAEEVIAEINALRASNDLPPYQVNSLLMVIAQAQADYMAGTGVVTHFGSDGSRPYQRALDAGYSVAGDLTFGGFFSENIQVGAELSPAEVVEIWQGDSAHLNTMISPDLKDIGVGVALQDGITYYVLDAGTSSNNPISTLSSDSVIFTPSSGTQSAPIFTSTPLEDGTVYHVVQLNEALWSIALAYGMSIDDLKKLNRLSSNDIFVGQKLLIAKPDLNTPTVEPSITVTLGIPTSIATHPATPTQTFTPTPVPTPPASRKSGELVVGGIILAALLAAGLGAWLGRKKSA